MATSQQQQDFLTTYGNYAKGVSYQTGIPSNFILGQWALETGWGTQFAGTYNVGNIQGAAAKPYNYTNIQQGVNAYGNTLSNMRYSNARTATTPEEFGTALKSAGYAADPEYASKIASVINQVSGLTGEPNSGGGMFDFSSFSPLEYLKTKGLDIVFIVVGGGLLIFLLANATKSQIAAEAVKGVASGIE